MPLQRRSTYDFWGRRIPEIPGKVPDRASVNRQAIRYYPYGNRNVRDQGNHSLPPGMLARPYPGADYYASGIPSEEQDENRPEFARSGAEAYGHGSRDARTARERAMRLIREFAASYGSRRLLPGRKGWREARDGFLANGGGSRPLTAAARADDRTYPQGMLSHEVSRGSRRATAGSGGSSDSDATSRRRVAGPDGPPPGTTRRRGRIDRNAT
ncbi:MAG: hypothetical protein EOP01_10630, partial [Propionibacteriaceae bacterium]